MPANCKTCIACEFFAFSTGEAQLSDITPGSPGYVICIKNHWRMSGGEGSQDLIVNVAAARTCSDYTVSHFAKSKGF